MEQHFKLSDTELEQQLASCALDPALFSHEAHLRLAWLQIRQYGMTKAKERIQQQLRTYVEHLGAADKYHTTLTIVAIAAVHHFMAQSSADNFRDFLLEFPQLKTNFKGLVNSHYSYDIFQSDEARQVFVAPDVKPL